MAAALLAEGKVLAVKGLGGYHLAVDAGSEPAAAALRQRKHREDKPFALMVADVEAAAAALRDRRDRGVAARQREAADRAAAAAGRAPRSRGRWRRAAVSSG